LGELTALPQTPLLDLRGKGMGKEGDGKRQEVMGEWREDERGK